MPEPRRWKLVQLGDAVGAGSGPRIYDELVDVIEAAPVEARIAELEAALAASVAAADAGNDACGSAATMIQHLSENRNLLSAEVERLRAALERISNYEYVRSEYDLRGKGDLMADIARAALTNPADPERRI